MLEIIYEKSNICEIMRLNFLTKMIPNPYLTNE